MARFKRTVHQELHNDNWISNLQSITTSSQVKEFTLLFMALSQIRLIDHKDEICWKWTKDGNYTVASAYDCQFMGPLAIFPAKHIWKAQTEPRCKFFA
jgi:hypothetical protein